MNQRPLGYEGKSGRHDNQEEPIRTSDHMGLQRDAIGASRLISVGLLHRRFISCPEPLIKIQFGDDVSTTSRSERCEPATDFLDQRSRSHDTHSLA